VRSLFENKVTFYIVSNNFPITQSSILGNDSFKQISSKIDYEGISRYIRNYYTLLFFKNHYSISANRIIVLHENRKSEIKIEYIPKIKVAHEIYLGDTIVENVSEKAFLNVISTLISTHIFWTKKWRSRYINLAPTNLAP